MGLITYLLYSHSPKSYKHFIIININTIIFLIHIMYKSYKHYHHRHHRHLCHHYHLHRCHHHHNYWHFHQLFVITFDIRNITKPKHMMNGKGLWRTHTMYAWEITFIFWDMIIVIIIIILKHHHDAHQLCHCHHHHHHCHHHHHHHSLLSLSFVLPTLSTPVCFLSFCLKRLTIEFALKSVPTLVPPQ